MAKIPSGASPMMRCLSSSHNGGRSSLHARFTGSSMRSQNSRHSLDGSIASRRMIGSPRGRFAVPASQPVTFERDPSSYRHWRLAIDPPVATVTMAVDPAGGLRDDYELKLNSYDLGVDIELYDVVQRLRFEHPEVRAVVVTGGLDKVFCAGANIQMLAGSTHAPQGELLQVHQRDPQRASRTRPPTPVRSGSPRSTAPPPAAATSSRWPATRSCWSTTARRPSRCPRSRCSACCPAPAG